MRATVVALDDDGRRATLFFENGNEQNFQWMELTQAGNWSPDASPRPTRNAAELKKLVLEKIAQHPVCPQGWDVVVEPTNNGRWKVVHKSPHPAIGYTDCANYAGRIALQFGMLFDLA